MNKIKLFCFPFAGGSSTFYNEWREFTHIFEVIPIEYNGRGKKAKENFYSNFEECIYDLFNEIKPLISNEEYAFFGHSMGSLVAYELAHYISLNGYNLPLHIFFSGKNSPDNTAPIFSNLSNLSDRKFVEQISKLGGIPYQILHNKELLNYFLPIIKNDINNLNNYKYKSKRKLPINFSVFFGYDDPLTTINDDWNNYTSKRCDKHVFNGEHFFIKDHIQEITKLIDITLSKYLIQL